MRRLACFVEGATELDFLARFINAIAGEAGLEIQQTELIGGGQTRIAENIYSCPGPNPDYYVLIFNCGNDGKVTTAIRDRYDSLVQAGYDMIVGVRDVYPEPRTILATLRRNIASVLPNGAVQCEVLFSIMEIEAWFIADHVHLTRIDPQLTPAYVHRHLNIDISARNVESFDHPTVKLESIYALVNRRYRKGRFRALQTLDRLKYDDLYLVHSHEVAALGALCRKLDEFF